MERRKFGNTDINASVLGFGAAQIGYQGVPEKDVARMLNEALDAGLNIIDTAECYVNSEELIGNTVASRRNDYFLFTKCGHVEDWKEDWSQASLLKSIERSLKRLKTDRVDLVLLHSCSEDILRKGEVIAALQEARKRGYTRYIGYSGDSHAAVYAIETGTFDALETSVNVVDQEVIDLVLPLAIKHNLGVIVKRPIANAAWKHAQKPDEEYHQTYWERFQKLDYPFAKLELQEAASVALRFTLQTPGVHTLIVGTSKPGRWLQNAALLNEGRLPASEYESIRKRWHEIAEASWIGQT